MMCMGKNQLRGLRKITVNDQLCYWTAKWDYPEGCRTVHLHVWGENRSLSPLYADLRVYTVTPQGVRVAIEHSLARGWDPQARGRPFYPDPADLRSLEQRIEAAWSASLS